jgi:NAD(P)-dependent dehydrogenase (short-subunit alcohol dehydrogenase family)
LVLTERNAEHLKVGASKIEAIGQRVATVACDVAADDTPDRLVKAALDLRGRIDALINNAGFMTFFADMLTVDDAMWDNIYAVNVRAPMRIMRAVLREMVKAERGSVINIGSSWSSRASVFNQDGGGVDYCSSKAALQSPTRDAAQDVAAKGFGSMPSLPAPSTHRCTPITAPNSSSTKSTFRSAACRSQKISPARRSSSPRTPAATSRGRPCTSMAA